MIKSLKQPTAWIPLAMSLAALTLVLWTVLFVGIKHSEDEGTAARLFQLLLVCQLPFVAYFAIKWLPKKRKEVIMVLVLQAIAGVIALAPVFILEL